MTFVDFLSGVFCRFVGVLHTIHTSCVLAKKPSDFNAFKCTTYTPGNDSRGACLRQERKPLRHGFVYATPAYRFSSYGRETADMIVWWRLFTSRTMGTEIWKN